MKKNRFHIKLIILAVFLLLAIAAYFFYMQQSFVTKENHQQKVDILFNQLSLAEELKRPYKIVFYGQSITEQSWWKLTAKAIQSQYPKAKFEFSNKAIGAHTSEKLVKLVDADVIAMHPDLVIFHVYGPHQHYEEIIKKIKTRTHAEILIATDHIGAFDDLNEETNPNHLSRRNIINKIHNVLHKNAPQASWNAWKNYVFFPHLAEKYGVVVIDVRSQWKAYLKNNHLKQRDLLIDNVHLNSLGNQVMAGIYQDFLNNIKKSDRENKHQSIDPNETLILVKRPLSEQEKTLNVECKGQRVQAILNNADLKLNENKLDIHVLVDGQAPSSFQSAYGFTRVSSYPNSNWPALLSVNKGDAMFTAESWKAKIFPKDIALNDFDFEVHGSKTGFDGRGNSKADFISNSKKIKIFAEDWNLAFAYSVFKQTLPEHFEITWKVEFRGSDQLNNPTISQWPIVQDIHDDLHHVVFSGKGLQAISAVRCFDQ